MDAARPGAGAAGLGPQEAHGQARAASQCFEHVGSGPPRQVVHGPVAAENLCGRRDDGGGMAPRIRELFLPRCLPLGCLGGGSSAFPLALLPASDRGLEVQAVPLRVFGVRLGRAGDGPARRGAGGGPGRARPWPGRLRTARRGVRRARGSGALPDGARERPGRGRCRSGGWCGGHGCFLSPEGVGRAWVSASGSRSSAPGRRSEGSEPMGSVFVS